MERFIERFRYKATKARQAQSRVKKLDKIERIERDPTRRRAASSSRSPRRERSGRVIFELMDGRVEVGEAPPLVLLEHAELWLERGEHVSLVGPNGTGKTTLIETLAGRRELAAGQAAARATTCRSATSPSTPTSSARAASRARACSRRRSARRG